MHAPNEEREGNGSNALAGSPWWVRAVWILGAPTLMALGLTYWLAMGADAKLSHVVSAVDTAAVAAVDHDDRVRTNFTRVETKQDESTRILLAMCVNAAKDEAARNRCLGR